MLRVLHTAAGMIALAAATIIPAGPASADDIRNQQWYLKALKLPQAHAISTGSGVTVAVIDTGVSPNRDLTENLLPGYNLVTSKPDGRTDTFGHGTNIAGLIAAHGRGNSGILGIAPSARLLPVKAGNDGRIGGPMIAKGIEYAISHKAQVINVSFAVGPAFELDDAVDKARAANAVIVAGSGNDGGPLVGYPAADDGVLAVGATDKKGKHWPDSTHGPSLQICAPGVGIVTTGIGNRYTVADGTSDSTAIVSGAVALVRAKFPQLSAAEVIHRITATADDIGPPGRDDECGYGELNIVKALTADVPPLGGASASANASASAATPTESVPTGSAASPATDDTGSSAPLVVGVVVVVLLVGGLVGFVALRRRGG